MKQTQDSLYYKIKKCKNLLPSKRTGISILTVLALITAIFVTKNLKGQSYNTKKLSVVTIGDVIVRDGDGDGIADWEERLWGTSTTNSDSDGDGVPDATEISLRKERLALQSGYNPESGYTENETDKFARELFVTYSALKEQGSVSQAGADGLANAALSASVQKLPTIAVHTTADLRIIPSDQASNLQYKKNILSLSQKNGTNFGAEFGLINQGIVQNDPDLLRKAGSYDKIYSDLKTNLLKINVPKNQATNHVRLLNNLSYMVATLPELYTLETDVLRGISLYTVYTKAYQDMFATFEAIGNVQ